MNPNQTTRALAFGAAVAFAAVFAHAAAYAESVSRAEVKEQTRAANKAGEIATGEEDAAYKLPQPVSVRTRADRKAETLAANRDGGLGSPGQALYRAYNVAPREALAKSTKTRAEGQAETLQAVRNHQVMGAGEQGEPSAH